MTFSLNKLLSKYSIALVPILTIFGACSNDETPDGPLPEISFSSTSLSDGIYTSGESGTVELLVEVSSENGIDRVEISFDGIDQEISSITPPTSGVMTFQFNFSISEIEFSGDSFFVRFTAFDVNGLNSMVEVEVVPDIPSVSFTDLNTEIEDGRLTAIVGVEHQVHYRYTFPGGFGQFKAVIRVGTDVVEQVTDILPNTQGLAVTSNFENTLLPENINDIVIYTFEITDKQGRIAQIELPVDVLEPDAKLYGEVMIENAFGNGSNTFFSSRDGGVYSVDAITENGNDISETIDFGFYFDPSDAITITGPANFPISIYNLGLAGENWNELNVTNFKRTELTDEIFDAFTLDSQEEITSTFDASTGDPQLLVSNLLVGEIISFRTSEINGVNITGIFRVNTISGSSDSDRVVKIEVVTNR